MYKQVIAVRNDLHLSKGKLAAQVAHASLDSYKKAKKQTAKKWECFGAKKVVVKAKDEKEILELYRKVKRLKLPHTLIRDAGKTEVKKGTVTALGIGPCESKVVDKVTGKLKIL